MKLLFLIPFLFSESVWGLGPTQPVVEAETQETFYEEIWIGRSHEEDWNPKALRPKLDHHLTVVEIYPLIGFDDGHEYEVCFIRVEDTLIENSAVKIPIDDTAQMYVLDLDGFFKPMAEIAVNRSNCSPMFIAKPHDELG